MPPCETSNVAQFVVKITSIATCVAPIAMSIPTLATRQECRWRRSAGSSRTSRAPMRRIDMTASISCGTEANRSWSRSIEAIGVLQQQLLSPRFAVSNVVQTNLTVLTPAHLDHLRAARFFSGLGVSFDVYGDQRVDAAGRLRTETVLKNIQALLDQGISFGAIAVLARNIAASRQAHLSILRPARHRMPVLAVLPKRL